MKVKVLPEEVGVKVVEAFEQELKSGKLSPKINAGINQIVAEVESKLSNKQTDEISAIG